MFCKITHICSAFQRKTLTLWYSLGKIKLFWQDHSIIAGISIQKSFFVEIKQQLYASAYCKALDAFWTIMSWALELCLSRWVPINYNDYSYSVFGVSFYRWYWYLTTQKSDKVIFGKECIVQPSSHSSSDGETNIPFMENQLATRFLHHILVMRVLVLFFSWLCILDTVCLSRLRKLPQIHWFLTKKSTEFREDFVGP